MGQYLLKGFLTMKYDYIFVILISVSKTIPLLRNALLIGTLAYSIFNVNFIYELQFLYMMMAYVFLAFLGFLSEYQFSKKIQKIEYELNNLKKSVIAANKGIIVRKHKIIANYLLITIACIVVISLSPLYYNYWWVVFIPLILYFSLARFKLRNLSLFSFKIYSYFIFLLSLCFLFYQSYSVADLNFFISLLILVSYRYISQEIVELKDNISNLDRLNENVK